MHWFVTLATAALFCFGCDGTDISDDDPNDQMIDASEVDAAAPIDADPNQPDAESSRATIFCNRYDTLCEFDIADANRFDDGAACLAAFGGFGGDQQDCVEAELTAFENDANQMHCTRATGKGLCN